MTEDDPTGRARRPVRAFADDSERSARPTGAARPLGKPVLFLSVSIGWAIRNFFLTGVVAKLREHFDVVALTTPKAGRHLKALGLDEGIGVRPIDVGVEPLAWKLFRQIKKKIYLEGRASATEAIWEKYSPRPFYQNMGSRAIKSALRLCDARRLYRAVENLDERLNPDGRFRHALHAGAPAIYFATHGTTYFEECLLRNALGLGIPAVFMILSWDHLSSKVFLNRHFEGILVWNRHTRDELLRTYPWYRPDRIRVVGIPQYDIYAQPPRSAYADWCRRYGLDPGRRTLLFSTMPQSRHDQQHLILEELLRAVERGDRLPRDLQVLIKCHPFDNFAGYDALCGRYRVGIHRSGLRPGEPPEDWVPTPAEIEAARDALYHCALNINIFSTVTIEAAYFDKPIVHIAFDPRPVTGRIPCHEYYNWDHFKPIVEKGASILAHSYDELFDGIRRSLDDPKRLGERRRELVQAFIGRPVGTASNAVVDELVRLYREVHPG